MIRFREGDIFKSGARGLVNPVNCVGVMGAGLALQFKKRYPKNYDAYYRACVHEGFRPGLILTVQENGVFIFNFPTKWNWRKSSKMEYIETGMEALTSAVNESGAESVAIPKLGCGLGGLDWNLIREVIVSGASLMNAEVMIYGEE